MPRADNANASPGFWSITVQKSAALPSKHFDPLESSHCRTQKRNGARKKVQRTPSKRCLGLLLVLYFPKCSVCMSLNR